MKKINGKKLLKNFVIALLGAIIGYLLYYSVIERLNNKDEVLRWYLA